MKERNGEVQPEEQNERENPIHKRRKLEETGEYKTVLKMKLPERREENEERSGERITQTRRKIEEMEDKEPHKLVGGSLYGHEIENNDWDEERRKRKNI